MAKRTLLLMLVGSMMLTFVLPADAVGWGTAGGNPEYDNTVDGKTADCQALLAGDGPKVERNLGRPGRLRR